MRVTKKNSKWPKKQKSDFKDSLHAFSKSGPSAGKAGVTSLFMQAIFSPGGPLYFGGEGGVGGFWEARPHSVQSHGQAALRCACVLFQGDCLGLEVAVPVMQGILPSLPLTFHQPLES